MIIRGNYTSEYLDILIEEYIEKNVICNICGNPETIILNIKNKKKCKACGSESY